MPKNKLSDLRDHLFETLERLKDADDADQARVEIERAHAVSQVAQAIVAGAKLELRAAELFGDEAAPTFFPSTEPSRKELRG